MHHPPSHSTDNSIKSKHQYSVSRNPGLGDHTYVSQSKVDRPNPCTVSLAGYMVNAQHSVNTKTDMSKVVHRRSGLFASPAPVCDSLAGHEEGPVFLPAFDETVLLRTPPTPVLPTETFFASLLPDKGTSALQPLAEGNQVCVHKPPSPIIHSCTHFCASSPKYAT